MLVAEKGHKKNTEKELEVLTNNMWLIIMSFLAKAILIFQSAKEIQYGWTSLI